MCVTNIAKRRNAAVANASAMVLDTPSLISQRLMGNFMPLMINNTTLAKPLYSTSSTCNAVGEPSRMSPRTGSLNTSFFQEQSIPASALGCMGGEEKYRPKRRRKPQKPGKTAKQNDRHFVVHNYHDHSLEPDENDEEEEDNAARRRGGVSVSFPTKLHTVLEQVERDGLSHVISWQPHGRCFLIHKPKEFTDHVMPHYFRQSKLTSFQRQLNLYGFCRLTKGKDSGGYYHELFLRRKLSLAKKMQRTKIKGTKFKAASSPDQEPDFYKMPFVASLAQISDDSSTDGSAVSGRRSPSIGFGPGMDFFQTAPNPVSPASMSIEHLPMQVRQTRMTPSLELYPIVNASGRDGGATSEAVSRSSAMQFPFNFMSLSRIPEADDILDQAVDELFNDASNVELDQSGDFDRLWDTTEFGEESREDDLYLGFMLDRLL